MANYSNTFNLTKKQIYILFTLVKGNDDGSFLDIDQLLENLPYETTKESIQFSIRALVKHGLIEKKPTETRRGRKRRPLAPTLVGFNAMNGRSDATILTPAGFDYGVLYPSLDKSQVNNDKA